MSTTFTTILTVFFLLLLGHIARRSGFLDEAFWVQAEKGTYYVLFPALLVSRLWQADFDWQAERWLLLAVFLLTLITAGISFLAQYFLKFKADDFTSFFQGTIRFNTYIGLVLVAALPASSTSGLTLAALLLAVMVPMVNVLSVLVYTLYADTVISWRRVGILLIKNPLVVACGLGITGNLVGWKAPVLVISLLDTLGAMALPLGLLAVGAGLRLKTLKTASTVFMWSVVLKLFVMPLTAWLVARALGLEDMPTAVLVIWAALPTAPSAYILARQMGGNAELMAGMITGQTLLALMTLPVLLVYLMGA